MMKVLRLSTLWLMAWLVCLPVQAEDLLMVRSVAGFPEAMSALQNSILEHKYQLSRVQRVDIGLTTAGYKTDKYRIVFFGKQEEYKKITDQYPEMAAYLPMKVAIFAEGDNTLLVSLNPNYFADVVDTPELRATYRRWEQDLRSILEVVRKAE